jgi:hypothetical protein
MRVSCINDERAGIYTHPKLIYSQLKLCWLSTISYRSYDHLFDYYSIREERASERRGRDSDSM